MTYDGSGNVSSWKDQAGNYTVSQTGSARPTFVASDFNGKPGVHFNGSQWLYSAANLGPGLNAGITMITLGTTSNPGALRESLFLGNGSLYTNRGMGYFMGDPLFDAFDVGGLGAPAPSANTWVTEVVTINSGLSTLTFYRNGSQTSTMSISGLSNLSPGITIGAPTDQYDPWEGDICEVLVYDHQLSSTELQQVSAYLAYKYNIEYDAYDAPTISPSGGSYSSSQTVTIGGPASPAVIKYTLDGSNPTIGSTTYTGSFTLTGSALVQATVFFNGQIASPTASEQFTFGGSNLPTTPTSLTTTVVSGHEIDLSWTLSGQLNYSGVYVYRRMYDASTSTWGPYVLIASLDPTATSYKDWSVQGGNNYQYYVGTFNSAGESDTTTASGTTTSSGTMSISVSAPSGATPLP